MINIFDDVLKEFLKQEMPIKNGEVDIAFDQPNREWSARLNRPTINIFLHDVRENVKLRTRHLEWEFQREPGNGKSTVKRRPVRVDLHYLITAWANEPEDEHSLLGRTLMALFRRESIPSDMLPEILSDQPEPIPIQVAQYDTIDKPSDIWNVLDNNQRAGVFAIFTLALNPYEQITAPLVRTRELRIGQRAPAPEVQELLEEPGSHAFWTIGGTIRGADEFADRLSVSIVELGRDAQMLPEGRFSIGNLQPGEYTLEIAGPDRQPVRRPITVPAPDYDFEI